MLSTLFKKPNKVKSKELEQLEGMCSQATSFLTNLAQGKAQLELPIELRETDLGTALMAMQTRLTTIINEELERTWVNKGLAQFSDILRNKGSLDLRKLGDEIISNLVRYVNANQGAIFLVEGEDNESHHLEMLSCYAYSRKKYLEKRIQLGEGLAGQCVLEKNIIYLKETPPDYVKITSGLGEAAPRSILLCPLIINDKVFGVVELASFVEFTPNTISFIQKVSEGIASSVKNVKENARREILLNATQQQAEELRAQEEEMRQNMEELQATQEEMHRKSLELGRSAAEMRGLIDGVNATMATIEFTPDGVIQTANENFLRTMGCTLREVAGTHHRRFVPDELANSNDYKNFWLDLANGKPCVGIFKRIANGGRVIWLNAIYNPIRNANGEVFKVIKFATDITDQQEALAESQSILSGIDAQMAMIQFTPDGTILTANANFLSIMRYDLNGVVGKHHKLFVPRELHDSEEYRTFWKDLSSGKWMTGKFKRVTADGKYVTLNAIYNPILTSTGQVKKVIKFATVENA